MSPFRERRITSIAEATRAHDLSGGFEQKPEYYRAAGEATVGHELPSGTVVYRNGRNTIVNKGGVADQATVTAAAAMLDRLSSSNPTAHPVTVTLGAKVAVGGATTVDMGQGINVGEKVGPVPFAGGFESFFMPSAARTQALDYHLAHEYGHALMYQHEAHGPRAMKLHGEHKHEQSPYGKTDYREGYAEAFAEYYLSDGKTTNPVAQAYAKQFGWKTGGSGQPSEAIRAGQPSEAIRAGRTSGGLERTTTSAAMGRTGGGRG